MTLAPDPVYRFYFRRGTTAEWTYRNPVLGLGEPGVEECIDGTEALYIGDGETPWIDLDSIVPGGNLTSVAGVLGVAGDIPGADLATALTMSFGVASTSELATKADLVGGVVPTSQIPAIAITDVFDANSQAAMLALTAQKGDVCIRTDTGQTYILAADPATVLGNWRPVSAVAPVTSVNGQVGIVVLGYADVGADQAGAAASAQSAAIAASQPRNTNLTSISALTTTAYGRAFLTLADAAAGRAALLLGGAAVLNVGAVNGTVAAGDDSRFMGEARSDTTSSFNYIGRALAGTADSSAGWTVTRISMASPPIVTHATGIWNNRASLTYT